MAVYIDILSWNWENLIVAYLGKLSLENKTPVLVGGFHVILLKYNIDTDIANFLDLMYS